MGGRLSDAVNKLRDEQRETIKLYSRIDELKKPVGSETPYSCLIQSPAERIPPLDGSQTGPSLHVRASAAELSHFKKAGLPIPESVWDCVVKSFSFGNVYRVEILQGDTWYKFYCKPPSE